MDFSNIVRELSPYLSSVTFCGKVMQVFWDLVRHCPCNADGTCRMCAEDLNGKDAVMHYKAQHDALYCCGRRFHHYREITEHYMRVHHLCSVNKKRRRIHQSHTDRYEEQHFDATAFLKRHGQETDVDINTTDFLLLGFNGWATIQYLSGIRRLMPEEHNADRFVIARIENTLTKFHMRFLDNPPRKKLSLAVDHAFQEAVDSAYVVDLRRTKNICTLVLSTISAIQLSEAEDGSLIKYDPFTAKCPECSTTSSANYALDPQQRLRIHYRRKHYPKIPDPLLLRAHFWFHTCQKVVTSTAGELGQEASRAIQEREMPPRRMGPGDSMWLYYIEAILACLPDFICDPDRQVEVRQGFRIIQGRLGRGLLRGWNHYIEDESHAS